MGEDVLGPYVLAHLPRSGDGKFYSFFKFFLVIFNFYVD